MLLFLSTASTLLGRLSCEAFLLTLATFCFLSPSQGSHSASINLRSGDMGRQVHDYKCSIMFSLHLGMHGGWRIIHQKRKTVISAVNLCTITVSVFTAMKHTNLYSYRLLPPLVWHTGGSSSFL